MRVTAWVLRLALFVDGSFYLDVAVLLEPRPASKGNRRPTHILDGGWTAVGSRLGSQKCILQVYLGTYLHALPWSYGTVRSLV